MNKTIRGSGCLWVTWGWAQGGAQGHFRHRKRSSSYTDGKFTRTHLIAVPRNSHECDICHTRTSACVKHHLVRWKESDCARRRAAWSSRCCVKAGGLNGHRSSWPARAGLLAKHVRFCRERKSRVRDKGSCGSPLLCGDWITLAIMPSSEGPARGHRPPGALSRNT